MQLDMPCDTKTWTMGMKYIPFCDWPCRIAAGFFVAGSPYVADNSSVADNPYVADNP